MEPFPELPTSESDCSLPSGDGPVLSDSDPLCAVRWGCSCKDGPCVPPQSSLETACKVLREGMSQCDAQQRRQRQWLLLRDMRVSQKVPAGQYMIQGTPVCRKTWQKAHLIGSGTLKELAAAVNADGLPPDGRKKGLNCHHRASQLSTGQQDVNKFLFHAYSHWAMHVPTEDGSTMELSEPGALPLEVECDMPQDDDSQRTLRLDDCHEAELAEPVVGPETSGKLDSRRYLPHMSWQEFYEMYCNWSDSPVHKTSFRRQYLKSEFKNFLRIADASDHNKCQTCERLKALRKKAQCEVQLKQIQSAQSNHVHSVMKDRSCDAQSEQLGRDSVGTTSTGCPLVTRQNAVLNWTQDAMDQAKFRVPRQIVQAKALSQAWRPQLAAHGLIFDGVPGGKVLFLVDQDIGKSANLQCCVTARALEARSSGI